jgi:hypothetical protein
MTIKLTVTWANAGHALLPDALAEIGVELPSGETLAPSARSPGQRRFDIPSDAGRVVLRAAFSVAFGQVGSVEPLNVEVLRVEQVLDVLGEIISAVETPPFGAAHPLVESDLRPGAPQSIRIQTQFVNITPIWVAYAGFADDYLESHDPRADLVALGNTGGEPKIWFASVPEACAAPPSPALGCLVFYRPSGATYDRIDQQHDMFGLNRYLLKAVEDPSAIAWKRDKFVLNPESGAPWLWVRCGFEDALARSGKAVVMLHPWPSALKYGSATSSALPSLAEAAIRLLWAEQRVGKERHGIHLGRLGLAGFSAGGLPLFEALAQNRKRVDEVYAFDARGVAERTAMLAAWMSERPSACLRMTGAHQLEANAAVVKAIARSPRGSELSARVTALPESAAAYEQPGATPHWDYALEEFPGLRSDPDARHQFAIFGGFDAQPGPVALTSLQRFLQGSLF